MTNITNCRNKQAISVDTNFNTQENPGLKIILEQIPGVEKLSTYTAHKYNFIVTFGAMFDREQIKEEVQEKIDNYINYK